MFWTVFWANVASMLFVISLPIAGWVLFMVFRGLYSAGKQPVSSSNLAPFLLGFGAVCGLIVFLLES